MENIGGARTTIARASENYSVIANYVAANAWIDFLAEDEAIRSTTSVCLKITDEWFEGLDGDAQAGVIGNACKLLESEQAAYDIKGYRDAPAGLRIWCGATVQGDDVEALMPWLGWAYASVKAEAERLAAA